MREKVGKSRNIVFFQWFGAPEGRKVGSLKRRVRSQLARWEMKKCTPLWREAHLQVKMYKTHHSRTTFGSWDVKKVHAVVARRTFPGQNVKNTRGSGFGPLLEAQMSFRVAGARDCAACQKWARPEGFVAFSSTTTTTPHYTPIHYTTTTTTTTTTPSLHSTTPRLQYTPLHYTTLKYTQLHSSTLNYTTLHYTTLHSTTLHYTTLPFTTLHYITLHYITLRSITLHYITLHYATFHYTTLHYTTLNYNYNYNYTTTLHYTPLH